MSADVLTAVAVVAGVVCSGGGVLAGWAGETFARRRRERPGYAGFHDGPLTVPGAAVRLGFRHCPAEGVDRPARIHHDGTATCDSCQAPIPAVD